MSTGIAQEGFDVGGELGVMLEQNQRYPALSHLAVGAANTTGCADQLVRKSCVRGRHSMSFHGGRRAGIR